MEINVIQELKRANVCIGKKLFEFSKDNPVMKYPSPLQIGIIEILICKKDEIVYQKDLQEKLDISKAAISDVIQSMEKKGMIERIPSSIDGRKNRILLTDYGYELFQELNDHLIEFNQKLLKDIQDEELEVFLNVLHKIKNNIRKEDES